MKNNPKKIILHCSITPDKGDAYGVKEIDKWHRARGWNGIGYHYVIRRSGYIERGRCESIVPAGVKGHNQDTIQICIIGTRRFTTMQYEGLVILLNAINCRHKIPVGDIYGHYEIGDTTTTCPNIDMVLLRKYLRLSGI